MLFLPFCCYTKGLASKWIPNEIRHVSRHAHSHTHSEKTHRIISFVTDIEGCANYLHRFVNMSRILKHESAVPQYCQTDVNQPFFPYTNQLTFQYDDDSILVVGGDLWDRGGSDLYVIRQLLSLHRRFPDRVYFLMGNRDINKMRIIQEMGGHSGNVENISSHTSIHLPHHPGVYWLRGTGMKGDPQSIDMSRNDETPADRLRWILSKTMGAPDAFELRKKELKQELSLHDNNGSVTVKDEDVVTSYLKSCHPSGEMGQYLSNAKLALRLGNALFLHGALPIVKSTLSAFEEYREQDIDSLPILSSQAKRKEFWEKFFAIATPWMISRSPIHKLEDWIDILNEFSSDQVKLWSTYIKHNQLRPDINNSNKDTLYTWSRDGGYFNGNLLNREIDHTRNSTYSFGSLLQYGMGWLHDRSKNPTVVYASWLNDGMPRRFMTPKDDNQPVTKTHSNSYAQLVSEFLEDFNIDVIVTGHQPVGDVPLPIQVAEGKFIVCCDTSYSGDTHWISLSQTKHDSDKVKNFSRKNVGRGNSFSGRGDVAVCELLIERPKGSERVTRVSCHGVLSDGSPYSSVNYLLDPRIGKGIECNIIMDSVKDCNIGDLDWWVKSIFSDGSVLLSKGSGYSVYNLLINDDSGVHARQ